LRVCISEAVRLPDDDRAFGQCSTMLSPQGMVLVPTLEHYAFPNYFENILCSKTRLQVSTEPPSKDGAYSMRPSLFCVDHYMHPTDVDQAYMQGCSDEPEVGGYVSDPTLPLLECDKGRTSANKAPKYQDFSANHVNRSASRPFLWH
jgi:hypothetical protein